MAGDEAKEFYEYFERRFGIGKDKLRSFRVVRRGKSFWVFSGNPEIPAALGRVESVGMRALNMSGKTPKPTTAFLRVIGKLASKNVVRLESEKELLEFMMGGIVRREFQAEPGYVIVVYKDDVLGCGLYSPRLGLVSQIPKHMRAEASWGFHPE